jgi:hypothetical protein
MAVKLSTAILVTDLRAPYGCETSRLPHFLENRLIDGGEVVSLKHRPPCISRKITGTHLLEATDKIVEKTT